MTKTRIFGAKKVNVAKSQVPVVADRLFKMRFPVSPSDWLSRLHSPTALDVLETFILHFNLVFEAINKYLLGREPSGPESQSRYKKVGKLWC